MTNTELDKLRSELDKINIEMLNLISERAKIAQEIGEVKAKQGLHKFDPVRERDMLDDLVGLNQGPLTDATVSHIFKQIFKACLELQEVKSQKALLVSREKKQEDTIVEVKGTKIGGGNLSHVFGPCAVESYEQVAEVAKTLKENGIKILRGGAFKPRTSPYDFQGLGIEGLKILRQVADEYDLAVISEVVEPGMIEEAAKYLDIIQIGARNMQNFELLKAAGQIDKPVLLKRGLAATIEEFVLAAEYIVSNGNPNVILCERGIRTYEKATRNTLDITAVPILKKETHLPVLVDVVHSTGRRDLLLPASKAALAIGADGIMAEVHPDPATALSDAAQQMDIPQFGAFISEVVKFQEKL